MTWGGHKARTRAWGFPQQDPGNRSRGPRLPHGQQVQSDPRSQFSRLRSEPPTSWMTSATRRSTWRQVVTPHRFPLGLVDPRVTGLNQPEVAVSKTGSGFKAAAIIPGPLNSAWSKRLGKMSDNVTWRSISFPEEAGEGQEVGGIRYRKLPVCADCPSPHPQYRLVFFICRLMTLAFLLSLWPPCFMLPGNPAMLTLCEEFPGRVDR